MRILRGKVVTPFQVIDQGQVEFEGSTIQYVGHRRTSNGEVSDYRDSIIAPGFIDLHIHGLAGYDAMDSDPESIQQISRHLAEKGVTGFLVTLQTAPHKDIIEVLKRVREITASGVSGAKVLGSHLEGPCISPKKIGAQKEHIRKPSRQELEEIINAADGTLKLVTLAPEIDGGLEAVQYLRERDVIVSAGHTDASYDEAYCAFDAGVSLLGHLWNGMRGLNHREPGIIGAGLEKENIMVELIADCHHVHPMILGLSFRLKGAEKIVLVSDSIKPAGLTGSEYVFDGRKYIIEDGLVKLDSGVIAGSSIGLNDAVRNMVEKARVSIPEAIQMASYTPSKALGLTTKGMLEHGYNADIVVLDDGFDVQETIVEGITVYKRSNP